MDIQRSFAPNGTVGNRQQATGKLYVVATPIGNLEDMTFRAIRTLREVDLIAAEDTRQTRKLLTHFEISNRLVSYHEHNKQASGPELVAMLSAGQSIALVSDAGMPAISDPGEDLVKLALSEGIPVIPIPGASASISALVISGFATASFRFVGFLPREKKGLKEKLVHLNDASDTLIIYESPHRLKATLSVMHEAWGDRRIALVRELTKKFEEAIRGALSDILNYLEEQPPKGEYVIVVEGSTPAAEPNEPMWWEQLTVEAHVRHYETTMQLPRKEAMKKAAADRKVSKRDIYNQLI